MDRKEFLHTSLKLGMCSCVAALLAGETAAAQTETAPKTLEQLTSEIEQLRQEKQFILNWITDLVDTIDKEMDPETKVKLLAGAGRGCYNRHNFKQDIASRGKGDLDKLVEAYKNNFEIFKDEKEEKYHIRYGEVSSRCYCPAAGNRPRSAHDLHCECTRATHQTIWEKALGRPIKVEIVESLRRGGKTCHFLVDPA